MPQNELKYFNLKKTRIASLSLIIFRIQNRREQHLKGAISVRRISCHRSAIKIFQSGPVLISLRPFVSPSRPKCDYVAKGCSSRIRNGGGGGGGNRGYRAQKYGRGRGRREADARERNGRKRRTRKEGWGGRLERASARGQVATKNQGTSEPPSSHARNLQLPPSRPRRYTYTRCFWGLGSIAGKPAAGAPSKSASLARGMSDTRGPDRCVRLVRNLNITTVSLRGPVPRTGPLRAIPRHPLRSQVNGTRVVLAVPLTVKSSSSCQRRE